MSNRFRNLSAFRKRDEGSATVEFVILFPVIIFIFLMGFESGIYMVRNVMLERAVDISVREIRLGNGRVPDYDLLKAQLCETAPILPDCADGSRPSSKIHISMNEVEITPGAIAALEGPARCTKYNAPLDEPQHLDLEYNVGDANTMMVIQVCASVEPFFPGIGIGLGLQNDELGGLYALVATTAFVTEPGTRSFAVNPDYDYSSSDSSDSGSGT